MKHPVLALQAALRDFIALLMALGALRLVGVTALFAGCTPALECRTDVVIPAHFDEPCNVEVTIDEQEAGDERTLVIGVLDTSGCAQPAANDPVTVRLPLIPGAEGVALQPGPARVALGGTTQAPLFHLWNSADVLLLEAGAPEPADDDDALATHVEEAQAASCVSDNDRDVSGVRFRADDEEDVIVAGGARTMRFLDVRYAVSVPYAFADDARYLRWRTDRIP